MSNALAIACVSALLRDLLNNGLVDASIGDVTVSVQPPDRISTENGEAPQVNLFLFRVSPNQGWRNSQSGATTAKPSVVTANVRPRTRRAGKPMAAITAAPMAPATRNRAGSVQPCGAHRAVRNAPTPTMAKWPRLTCPPQPTSMVRATPSRA